MTRGMQNYPACKVWKLEQTAFILGAKQGGTRPEKSMPRHVCHGGGMSIKRPAEL